MIDAPPQRYRALGVLAAGCALRQGEAFGVRVRYVNFLRRQVHVEQQVKIVAAGVEPTRYNGMQALQHFYASVLIDAGESVRAVAEYLGHSDPGFTLRVYTHLFLSSEDRARRAVDDALGAGRVEGLGMPRSKR